MTANPIIVGLGEILWDVFPEGAKFGGAPANFACSAAALAGPDVDVYMASAVGNDDLGDQAIDQLRQRKVHVDAVTRSQRPNRNRQRSIERFGFGHLPIHKRHCLGFFDLRLVVESACRANERGLLRNAGPTERPK